MKIVDISKYPDEVLIYINELNDKYAELEKLNKQLDESNITIFRENESLAKEIERLNKEIIGLNNCIIEFHSEFCNKQAEINRLNNIIEEAKEFIYENAYDSERQNCIDDLWGEIPKLLEILDKENK